MALLLEVVMLWGACLLKKNKEMMMLMMMLTHGLVPWGERAMIFSMCCALPSLIVP